VLPRLNDAQRLLEVQAQAVSRGAWSAGAGLAPDQQAAYGRLAQKLTA
jgi:hypothetical protein